MNVNLHESVRSLPVKTLIKAQCVLKDMNTAKFLVTLILKPVIRMKSNEKHFSYSYCFPTFNPTSGQELRKINVLLFFFQRIVLVRIV